MVKKQLHPASMAEQFTKTMEVELEAVGQQRLIEKTDAKETSVKNVESPKMEQSKKCDKPTKHLSILLPSVVIENLKILAKLRKISQTQLVLSMINKELKNESDRIKTYKESLKL